MLIYLKTAYPCLGWREFLKKLNNIDRRSRMSLIEQNPLNVNRKRLKACFRIEP